MRGHKELLKGEGVKLGEGIFTKPRRWMRTTPISFLLTHQARFYHDTAHLSHHESVSCNQPRPRRLPQAIVVIKTVARHEQLSKCPTYDPESQVAVMGDTGTPPSRGDHPEKRTALEPVPDRTVVPAICAGQSIMMSMTGIKLRCSLRTATIRNTVVAVKGLLLISHSNSKTFFYGNTDEGRYR